MRPAKPGSLLLLPGPVHLNSPEAQPLLGFCSRYSDKEQLALRAWSSAKLRQAPLAEQVETLRHYPGLEPVYAKLAKDALNRQCPRALADAAKDLWYVTARRDEHRLTVRRLVPRLADTILA